MSKLHLITVATSSKGYFKQFVESCKKYNMNLTVLGWGMQWQGFTWRLKIIKEFINRPDIKANDIICFVDAFDVVCMESSDELLRRFQSFKSDIVFMTEDAHQKKSYKITYGGLCDGNPVNGGCVIGYAKRMKELLALPSFELHSLKTTDDQVLWTKVCEGPDAAFFNKYVKYDVHHHIMYNDSYKVFETHCKALPINQVRPVFYHCLFNRNMEYILTKEGYDIKSEGNAQSNVKRIVYYIKLICYTNIVSVIMFVATLFIFIALLVYLFKKNGLKINFKSMK